MATFVLTLTYAAETPYLELAVYARASLAGAAFTVRLSRYISPPSTVAAKLPLTTAVRTFTAIEASDRLASGFFTSAVANAVPRASTVSSPYRPAPPIFAPSTVARLFMFAVATAAFTPTPARLTLTSVPPPVAPT